ncbi:MAG TPA: glycosyltransferase family 1 protein, partial [Armatimonadota bacterium]|nr:glycosyltransferase family 1 protein [Armatimonadota bacterium]
MHIVVDALLVYGAFSGVQHATLHQLRALLTLETRHRFTILALEDVPIERHLGETARPYRVIRAPVRAGQRLKRLWWQQAHLKRLLADEDAELLYAPGYLIPLRWDGPSVVFIHDTIALTHPHLCRRGNALNYRLLLPPSARRATLVATPSDVSARDVVRHCRVPLERVRTAPLGVEMPPMPAPEAIAAARARLGIAAPFLLAVSTIEPKKNFANLIRWFDAWKAAGLPHHLVIVGTWGWGYQDVQRALARARFRACIHLPGYLPQAELPPIIAAADVLLMPSRYEGFGLPALEAMAVGTPVVASNQGALPETVGDAGLIIPLERILWQAEIPT